MKQPPPGGSRLASAIFAIAVAAILGGGCYAVFAFARDQSAQVRPDDPAAGEIAHATTNLFLLFRDAQYDFIHRHDGTMAKSVTELGDGFSIGSFGSLIHEEIWLARFDRPEGERPAPEREGILERDALARPYRYAVLPVDDCLGEALDRRTTCILALPVDPARFPLLVLLGGPIRSDPGDFYRDYPVHRVSEPQAIGAFRDAAASGGSVGKEFLDRFLPEWNDSADSEKNGATTTTQTTEQPRQ